MCVCVCMVSEHTHSFCTNAFSGPQKQQCGTKPTAGVPQTACARARACVHSVSRHVCDMRMFMAWRCEGREREREWEEKREGWSSEKKRVKRKRKRSVCSH